MISPDQGADIDPAGIYSRVFQAVHEAKTRRAILARSCSKAESESIAAPTAAVFLGESEWNQLTEFCRQWGHEWKGANPSGYDPAANEETRAEFAGARIYRVDAASFLAAT